MNFTSGVRSLIKFCGHGSFMQHIRFMLTCPTKTFSTLRDLRLSHTSHNSVENKLNPDFDVMCLANGDKDLEKRLKILLLEVDIMRQEGERVPAQMNAENWQELISLGSRNARKKFLLFCWKKEMRKSNDKKKKEEESVKRTESLETKERLPKDPLEYGLSGNTMFLRVRESTMMNFYNSKLIEAMRFSQNELVVDCGYDQHMTRREAKDCGKQLMFLFSENRMHINPFNLYFCNAKRESWSMVDFEKIVKTAFEPHFPLNITDQSYLDLFPKEKLVYLTPHCREELVNYDHDSVYIIGGLVDKTQHEPLSLARAKEQGLKMAKLPLERYLSWGSGSGKSLTLNQMILILLDIRLTGDWNKALVHVPSRKIQKVYHVDYSANTFKVAKRGENLTNDTYNQLIIKNKTFKKVS